MVQECTLPSIEREKASKYLFKILVYIFSLYFVMPQVKSLYRGLSMHVWI